MLVEGPAHLLLGTHAAVLLWNMHVGMQVGHRRRAFRGVPGGGGWGGTHIQAGGAHVESHTERPQTGACLQQMQIRLQRPPSQAMIQDTKWLEGDESQVEGYEAGAQG